MADQQVDQRKPEDQGWITINPNPEILSVTPKTLTPPGGSDEWVTIPEDRHKDDSIMGRMWDSFKNSINLVGAAGEWYHRPEQTAKMSKALRLGMEARHRPLTPEEQQTFNEGFDAAQAPPMGPILPMGTEPLPVIWEQAKQGNVAGAVGTGIGSYVAPYVVGKGLQLGGRLVSRPFVKNILNPVERESQAYLEQHGIETPLSMKTGSETVQGIEKSVQTGLGGGKFGQTMRQSKQDLMRLGQQESTKLGPQMTPEEAGTAVQEDLRTDLEQRRKALEQRTSPQPATPEMAGEGILNKGKQLIKDYQGEADQNYNAAWKVEQDPRNMEMVQAYDENGRPKLDEQGQPVMERIAVPLDGSEVQAALGPVARRYAKTLSDTDARASLGLKTMREIINSSPVKSLREWEMDLGLLKQAAESEGGLAELRDTSQGLAAFTLKKLNDAIEQRMASAHYPGYDPATGGPHPGLEALRAGRLATAKKYQVAEMLQGFGRKDITQLEPVSVFKQMTWTGDAGINRLRQVADMFPDQMPAAGRAFIESGGDWEKLGPETKKIFFRDPGLIKDLDQYHADFQRFGPLLTLEPVGLFDKLTAGYGRYSNLVRDVAEKAPQRMPGVARSFFQGLLDRMTRGGEPEKIQSTLDKWLDWDPASKNRIVNNPSLVKDIDNLMFSFKRMAANPNPSGSGWLASLAAAKSNIFRGIGLVGGGLIGAGHGVAGAGMGVGAGYLLSEAANTAANWGLARLLFNPTFTRLMTQGLQLAQAGNTARANLIRAQLVAMANEAETGGAVEGRESPTQSVEQLNQVPRLNPNVPLWKQVLKP